MNLLEYWKGRDGPDPVDWEEEEPRGRLANEMHVQVGREGWGCGQPEVDHRIGNKISFDENDFFFRFGIGSAVTVVRPDCSSNLVQPDREMRETLQLVES